MKQYEEFVQIDFVLNGERVSARFDVDATLLQVVRNVLGQRGNKAACENGDCGACTMLLNGTPVKACLVLALDADGQEVTSIEGLKDTAIQQAFKIHQGYQCGYCTSGYIMNAHALLQKHPDADEETKKRWLSANLCRCTGYEGIAKAVEEAQAMISTEASEM